MRRSSILCRSCLVAFLSCMALPALAGPNQSTWLVMHAIETQFGPCYPANTVNCNEQPPEVSIPVGATFAGYLLIGNFDNVAGVQTAFEWPAWQFLYGLWDCQSGQVNGITPTAPGPTFGTITTAFDCLWGGDMEVIGRMHFIATEPGCLFQVESSYPFGNHVVSCAAEVDQLQACWGMICAGRNGWDACSCCGMNHSPSCDAGGPYAAGSGDTVEFDGTGSYDDDGVVYQYEWTFGDGSTGSGALTTHVYAAAGEYTVTLCAIDNGGEESCCDTAVHIGPVPVELSSFELGSEVGAVTIVWTTSIEEHSLGFHVHRADGDDTRHVRVNTELIPSAGGASTYRHIDTTVRAGETYSYRLESLSRAGESEFFDLRSVSVPAPTPLALVLHPAHPNPTRRMPAGIRFELPEPAAVSLVIYDAHGRAVRSLVRRHLAPERYDIEWDGRDERGRVVGAGVYIYRLQVGERLLTRKLVVVR